MGKSEVVDRAGNRWVVRRRWTPRWTRVDVGKRFRRAHRRKRARPTDRARSWGDLIEVPFHAVDDIRALVLVAVIIVVLLILWFAMIPLLLILFDMLIVIVLFLVGLATRVLLRRPWIVVATRGDGVEIQREVVGWRASRDEIAALRHQIELGLVSPSPSPSPSSSSEPA